MSVTHPPMMSSWKVTVYEWPPRWVTCGPSSPVDRRSTTASGQKINLSVSLHPPGTPSWLNQGVFAGSRVKRSANHLKGDRLDSRRGGGFRSGLRLRSNKNRLCPDNKFRLKLTFKRYKMCVTEHVRAALNRKWRVGCFSCRKYHRRRGAMVKS